MDINIEPFQAFAMKTEVIFRHVHAFVTGILNSQYANIILLPHTEDSHFGFYHVKYYPDDIARLWHSDLHF